MMVAGNNNDDSGIYLQQGNTPLKSINNEMSYNNFKNAMITELMAESKDASKPFSLSDLLKKTSSKIIELVEEKGQITFEKDENGKNFPSMENKRVHAKSPFAQLVNVIAQFEKNPTVLTSAIISADPTSTNEHKKKCKARNTYIQGLDAYKNANSSIKNVKSNPKSRAPLKDVTNRKGDENRTETESNFEEVEYKTVTLSSKTTKDEFNQFLQGLEQFYKNTSKQEGQREPSALSKLMNVNHKSDGITKLVNETIKTDNTTDNNSIEISNFTFENKEGSKKPYFVLVDLIAKHGSSSQKNVLEKIVTQVNSVENNTKSHQIERANYIESKLPSLQKAENDTSDYASISKLVDLGLLNPKSTPQPKPRALPPLPEGSRESNNGSNPGVSSNDTQGLPPQLPARNKGMSSHSEKTVQNTQVPTNASTKSTGGWAGFRAFCAKYPVLTTVLSVASIAFIVPVPLRIIAAIQNAKSGGADIPTTKSGGADIPTTKSGGADIPTTKSGGVDIPTTKSGGVDIPTTKSGGVDPDYSAAIDNTAQNGGNDSKPQIIYQSRLELDNEIANSDVNGLIEEKEPIYSVPHQNRAPALLFDKLHDNTIDNNGLIYVNPQSFNVESSNEIPQMPEPSVDYATVTFNNDKGTVEINAEDNNGKNNDEGKKSSIGMSQS